MRSLEEKDCPRPCLDPTFPYISWVTFSRSPHSPWLTCIFIATFSILFGVKIYIQGRLSNLSSIHWVLTNIRKTKSDENIASVKVGSACRILWASLMNIGIGVVRAQYSLAECPITLIWTVSWGDLGDYLKGTSHKVSATITQSPPSIISDSWQICQISLKCEHSNR